MDQDLAEMLGIDLNDPAMARELRAVEQSMDIIEGLVKLREDQGLTVEQVAERSGLSVEQVEEFERVGGDPYLSTLARYALGVGHPITISRRRDG